MSGNDAISGSHWRELSGASVDDLRAFVGVARLGAVSRAAEYLGRTQPSISARLAALEDTWGTRLFLRRSRGMEPTPEGERLLPLAVAALEMFDSLEMAAGAIRGRHAEVRVGAGDALGRKVVPRALGRLLEEFPGAGVRILEGSGRRLLDALSRGDIDVALVAAPAVRRREAGISLEPFNESPVDVLFPADRKPRGRRTVSLGTLQGERLVTLHSGSSFRRHLETGFAHAAVPFEPAVEVGSLSLVRRYVVAGLGIAPVPALAFDGVAGDSSVVRRRLKGIPSIVYVHAVRRNAPLPPPAARFLEILSGTGVESRS
jgi:DNA-binding transcriptional LysR family regulator